MVDEELSAERIKRGLQTAYVGQNVLYFKSIDSTNTVAKDLARLNAADGTLIVADRQTEGRGRLGRQWLATPGTSLLMSLIFRPELAPEQSARMTMVCSLSVAEAIEAVAGLSVRLKWPNDILIGGRKVSGILTELGTTGSHVDFVVVGIGLNVNVDFGAAEDEFLTDQAPDTSRASVRALAAQGTSLLRELGRPVSRIQLLQRALLGMELRYEELRHGRAPVEEWISRLDTLGREVTVSHGDESISGRAESVDADGALLLRRPDGRIERVLAGDVTLRAPKVI